MADAIKSVVLQVETILKGNAIEQAVKGLENADGAAAELRKTLESVQAELKKISAQKPLDAISKEVKQTDGFFANLKNRAGNLFDSIKSGGAKAADILKGGFSALTETLNANILAYAGVAGGIAGIIALPIAAFFKTTKDGADLLNETLGGFKNVANQFVNGVATIGRGILSLDFSTIAQGARDAFRSLNKEVFEAGVRLEKFRSQVEKDAIVGALQGNQLNTRFAKNRAILAETRTDFVQLLEAQAALNQLESDAIQIGIIKENQARNKIALTEEQIAGELGLSAAELRRRDVLSLPDNQRDRLIQARIELDQELKEIESLNKIVQNETARLNKDRERLLKDDDARLKKEAELRDKERAEQQKRINRLKDLLVELRTLSEDFQIDDPFNLDKIANDNDIIKAQRKIEDFAKKIDETLQEAFDITKKQNLLEIKPEKLRQIEKNLGLVSGSLLRLQIDSNFIENQIKDALDRINQSRPKVEVEILPTIGGVTGGGVSQGNLPDISGQISKAVEATTPKKKTFFEIFFGDEKGKQAFDDAIKQIETSTNDLLNQFYESEIAKTDFLIQEQQRRIDETNRLAAFGNAEQLQLEQERLNKLLEERRKFEQAQAAINAAAAISATAVAASTFAASITKESLSTTPLVAIANSIALVAAIGAGIAQISALASGFEKGTEYLTPGQKSNKGKTDTIPAWLAPGERVVPAMINEQLKGIKNADLPKLVAAGKMALEGYGQLNTSITSNSYGFTSEAVGILKRVEAGISEIPRALSDQIVDINFDHYGYVIQQRRVSRHAQKVKALTR